MKPVKTSTLRTLSILVFVGLTLVGLAFKTGTGTLSAFGYGTIASICPLGGIEALLASRTLVPHVLISLAVFLLLAIALGRVFCAWVCPVPLLREWFSSRRKDDGGNRVESANFDPQRRPASVSIDSRHYVLGSALISAAVFGFPVFCLVCPLGLTFAILIGIWRLLQFNEPTWTLLVFPAVLILELVVLRRWCRKICPLGALVSLFSSLNRFVRPQVNESACLRTAKGVNCNKCRKACFEAIDLHHLKESRPLSECTKCRECADACPMHAITFPIINRKP